MERAADVVACRDVLEGFLKRAKWCRKRRGAHKRLAFYSLCGTRRVDIHQGERVEKAAELRNCAFQFGRLPVGFGSGSHMQE